MILNIFEENYVLNYQRPSENQRRINKPGISCLAVKSIVSGVCLNENFSYALKCLCLSVSKCEPALRKQS